MRKAAAPMVTEKIITTVEKAGVRITHDPGLVKLLTKIPLGAEIPE